jgi:5'/3'-nucleotidase SurE
VAYPLLLVSNDDGYHSEGIHVLVDALESLGEVWVVAPDRENSAVSHALTLSRPLRLSEIGERHFMVDGTPTDCVTLGIGQVLKDRLPDLVVSGINFGANMGDDVHYSGTVSAAFEAAILGVPAIAVSQVIGKEFSFVHAGRFARLIASRVLERRARRSACASRGWGNGCTPRESSRTPIRAGGSATGSVEATRFGRTSRGPTSPRSVQGTSQSHRCSWT